MKRGLLIICVAASLAASLAGGAAKASTQDDLAEFQLAMNAYDTGDYTTAEKRFRALLERDPPLDNKALEFEVHKYLAATLMFLGKTKQAEAEFEALLKEDPDYELDPVLFPTDILDTFYKVKLRISDELLTIQKKKEEEALKAKAEKEAMKKKLQEKIREATQPVYLERSVKSRNPLFALVPFGVGQFQNGHMTKGYIFLGGELTLLAANISLWALSVYSKRQYDRAEPGRKTKYKNSFESYKLATNIMGGVVIAAMVAGIIDAIVFYVKQGDGAPAWTPVDAKEVPPELQKQPIDLPEEDLDVLLGFSWAWRF